MRETESTNFEDELTQDIESLCLEIISLATQSEDYSEKLKQLANLIVGDKEANKEVGQLLEDNADEDTYAEIIGKLSGLVMDSDLETNFENVN